MVVHKRDDPQTSITHLLITVRECKENEAQHRRSGWAEYTKAYPPSMNKPPYRTNNTDPHQRRLDNNHQDQACYHRQDNNNSPNITIHAAQVEPTMEIQAEEDYIPLYIDYDNTLQDRDDIEMTFYTEVYAAAIRMADDTKQRDNQCYNCKEMGHFWCQCTKPLKEEFQWLIDHPKQKDNELNKKGGPGAKDG